MTDLKLTKNNITITVRHNTITLQNGHPTSVWEYFAIRDNMTSHGSVTCETISYAWELAYAEAVKELWTAEEILQREG